MKASMSSSSLSFLLLTIAHLSNLPLSDAYYSLATKFPQSAKLLPQPLKVHACYNDKSQLSSSGSKGPESVCMYKKLKSAQLNLLGYEGIIESVFSVPPACCNFTSLELKLRIDDSVTNSEQCKKAVLPAVSTNVHSSKSVLLTYEDCSQKNCSTTCEEEIRVTFRYIFSGCYQLWITPFAGENSLKAIVTPPSYMNTKYSKKKVSQYEVPVIKTKYIADGDDRGPKLIANAYFESSFFDSEQLYMSFLLLSHVDPHSEITMCYKTGVQQSNCLILWSNSQGVTECETKGVSKKNFAGCSIVDRHRLECEFYGIQPGRYCVRVDLWDERCFSNTLWSFNISHSEPCSWHHQFTAVESDTVQTVDIPESIKSVTFPYILLFMGVVFFICLVVFFGAWSTNRLLWRNVNKLFLLKNNSAYDSQYTVSFTPTPDKIEPIFTLQPTILLIYARDCQLFMDAMVIFRNVLKNVAKCEVYDCWDPNQWEKVAESTYDWVIGLASDPSVRIVVVCSEMAQLVETSLQHSSVVKYRYRHPECFDNIFIFALKYIVANTITNSYKRVFITRLEGFPPEGSRFTSLNPHTVYTIPDHFQLLIAALHHLGSKELSLKETDDEEISKFRSIVDELKLFYQKDPRYIYRMIDKS
nr:PREDICTED: uncharacterized protein LOC109042600 [Bemisia tabaci]